jgi:hypothetical protein
VIRAEGDSKLDYSKLFVVLMPAPDTDPESVDIVDGFGNGSGYAEVGKDGSFKLDAEPSVKTYQVVLSARGAGLEDWFASKILFAGKDVVESGLKITDAEQRTMEVIVSDKGALLVRDRAGRRKEALPERAGHHGAVRSQAAKTLRAAATNHGRPARPFQVARSASWRVLCFCPGGSARAAFHGKSVFEAKLRSSSRR